VRTNNDETFIKSGCSRIHGERGAETFSRKEWKSQRESSWRGLTCRYLASDGGTSFKKHENKEGNPGQVLSPRSDKR